MREPLVSVVLPSYDRGHLLARSATSVLAQSEENIELIIVDDASTDDTRSVIEGLAADDERVRAIHHPRNRGANAARNTGAAAARGRFLAFQDSDDVWHPDKLARQLDATLRLGARVCFCAMERCDGAQRQRVPKPGYRISPGLANRQREVLRGSFISCQVLLIERSTFASVGGFNEALQRLQDWELVIRLSRRADILFVPDVLVSVHQQPDSISARPQLVAGAIETLYREHEAAYRSDRTAAGMLFINAGLGLLAAGHGRGLSLLLRGIARAGRDTPQALLELARRRR